MDGRTGGDDEVVIVWLSGLPVLCRVSFLVYLTTRSHHQHTACSSALGKVLILPAVKPGSACYYRVSVLTPFT